MINVLRGLLILFFLSTPIISCAVQNDISDGEDYPVTMVSLDSCDSYRSKIATHIKDGSLLRADLWEAVPYIRTSFKSGSTYVRVPMQIVDINQDSEYELLYLIDITSPKHEETKLFLVRYLSSDVASSLISLKYKSPFYRSVMDDLAVNYVWDAKKDIKDGAYQISLPIFFEKKALSGDSLRLSLIDLDGRIYLLVEGMKSRDAWLVKFKDSKNLEREPSCSFEKLFN